MFSKKLVYGNRFSSLEIAEDNRFYFLQVFKKKHEVNVFSQRSFDGVEDAVQKIKQTQHIHLIFNNEKVLSKMINDAQLADKLLFSKAFPNTKLSDFYFDIVRFNNSAFISIVRKQDVQSVITHIENEGVTVSGFSIGNGSVFSNITIFLEGSIYTSNLHIELKENQPINITAIKPVSKEILLGELKLESDYLLGFTTALQFYKGELKSKSNELLIKLHQNFFQKRMFDIGIRFGLGILFVGLLVNFLFFSSYSAESEKNKTELALNSAHKKQLVSLNNLVEKKKLLVTSMESISDSRVTWLLNTLLSSVPSTVYLEKVTYQPKIKTQAENKPITFIENQVVVKGTSVNDTKFTEWLQYLEEADWTAEVRDVDYGTGSSKENSFEFVIVIKDGV